MRTLLSIKQEIAELVSSRESMKKAQYNRAKKRIEFLRMVELYLEKGPEELFISKEIARLENRIRKLMDAFDGSLYKDPKLAMKQYEKEMGVIHLRTQIRALRFIKN